MNVPFLMIILVSSPKQHLHIHAKQCIIPEHVSSNISLMVLEGWLNSPSISGSVMSVPARVDETVDRFPYWPVCEPMGENPGFLDNPKQLWRKIKLHRISNEDDVYICKVHIFWEGHKIFQNLHRRFVLCSNGQIYSGGFTKLCGHLRKY